MGLNKGQTNNRQGRPKGKPNKITTDLRDVLQSVLNKELTTAKLSGLLSKLEPQQRLNALTKLLEFTIPKLQSVSIEQQIQAEYESLEALLESAPDEAVNEIFERIKKLKENGKTAENQ